jgi:subtilisin family serine protease
MLTPLQAAVPAATGASDSLNNRAQEDKTCAIIQLKGDALSTYEKTQPARGKKIDFTSNAVKSYRARLAALRNDFKAWLRENAVQAKVTGEFDISLNAVSVQLNGVPLETIARAPQVLSAQYEILYYPNVEDPDLTLIHAVEAWALDGGPANAGAEVKVAVIDTGIDINHPCFSDAGYPARAQLGGPPVHQ